MTFSYIERSIPGDICERCPSRNGAWFTAQLRGSSYRGRMIPETDTPEVSHCILMVGEVTVADVVIANQPGDTSAAEHDTDFIRAVFEDGIVQCDKPITELTSHGVEVFCGPYSQAVDEFVRVNYSDNGVE